VYTFSTTGSTPITKTMRLHNILNRLQDEEYRDPLGVYVNKDVYNEPVIRDIKNVATTFIKAPMKIGKTKKLKAFLSTLDKSKTICILSFRVFFSTHLATLFTGEDAFTLYKDIKNDISPTTNKRVIVQIESMHRIRGVYDVVILDESESIFAQFDSGNVVNISFAVANLSYMLKYAKNVIAMDAFMSKRTVEIIKSMRGADDEVIEINTYKNATDYTYNLTYTEVDFLRRMNTSLEDGKNIAIVSNKLSKLNEYKEYIDSKFPLLHSIIYSSKSDPEIKKKHMRDINTVCRDYNVMLYSPTLTAGVSIEIDHFHEIYGYFTNQSCDAMSCMQMLGRIRNVRDRKINICLNTTPTYCSTTMDAIERDVCEGRYDLLNSNLSDVTLNISNENSTMDNIRYKICKNEYYNIWIYNQMMKNISRSAFEQTLITYILSTGANIKLFDERGMNIFSWDGNIEEYTPITDDAEVIKNKNIPKELRSAKENYRLKEATCIANAGDITMGIFVDLLKKSKHDDTLTLSEYYLMEKFKFKRYYNIPIATIDLVLDLNNIRARSIYHNLNIILREPTLAKSLARFQQEEQIKMKSIMDSTFGNDLTHKYEYEYHNSAVKLINAIGYDDITSDDILDLNIVNENIKAHEPEIKRTCKKFNIYPIASIKNISNILNQMYGYVLSKRNDTIRLRVKHKFTILPDRTITIPCDD
jgi:hypothetical protein